MVEEEVFHNRLVVRKDFVRRPLVRKERIIWVFAIEAFLFDVRRRFEPAGSMVMDILTLLSLNCGVTTSPVFLSSH